MTNTLFLHDSQSFHNLSTCNSQTYPRAYPQTYQQVNIMISTSAQLHGSHD